MSNRYEVTRAAVEVSKVELTPEEVELDAINRQQRRWSWLSIATMIVSFIHMVGALAMFSAGHKIEQFAAVLMTGLVDGATWVVANYQDYAKRRKLTRSKLVSTLLWVALSISFGLNLAYLLTHRPATLHPWISSSIAIAFAIFIPLCIAVASLARGELEDDKTHLGTVNVDTSSPEKKPTITLDEINEIINVMREQNALPLVDTESVIEPIPLDTRAMEWLKLNDAGHSYGEISRSLGGTPSRAFIGRQVKLARERLTQPDPSVDD